MRARTHQLADCLERFFSDPAVLQTFKQSYSHAQVGQPEQFHAIMNFAQVLVIKVRILSRKYFTILAGEKNIAVPILVCALEL